MDQSKALSALGHEVRILSNVQLGVTTNKKDFFALPANRFEHEMDGILVYQSYQRGLPRMVRLNVGRWVNIVCSMFEDYVKKYGNPDVLHAHCAKWAGYAVMQINERHGIPYVITEHLSRLLFEEEFGPAPSSAWPIPLLKKAYHEASMVLPVSEELVNDVACYFGDDYKWQALSNTIDTDFFAYKPRPEIPGRRYRFCCIANYWPLKGYDVLFAAIRKLQVKGLDIELQIAGMGTDSHSCLQAIEQKQLHSVTTHGLMTKEAVRNLLYESDALVLASRSEVQPLVLLEAMSTGIPVVATECVPHSLRISGGCSIVPIDDVDALAQAMEHVMATPRIDGEKLSKQVKALASPQVVGKRLETIFYEVIASH